MAQPTGLSDSHDLEQEWLTTTEAASRLGVHASTLRRWSDSGEIPVLLTPGGHRRFAASDLAHFSENRRRLRIVSGIENMWAKQALSHTRHELTEHRGAEWLTAFDEKDREHKRQLGRQLMGLMLRYVSSPNGGDQYLEEARAIGVTYALEAKQSGMPLKVALEAAMFFRDTIIEAALNLPETAHIRPESNLRLVRRLTQLLNSIQLAIVEVFES